MLWEVFRDDWGLMPGFRITCGLVISFDFSVPLLRLVCFNVDIGVVSMLTQDCLITTRSALRGIFHSAV